MAGMTDRALRETRFIDSGHPEVKAFAAPHLRPGDDVATAVNLYYAIRDAVPYDIRAFGLDEDDFVASRVLTAKSAFCVPKAIALAALARAAGIPSRVGFANVRNHLTTPKITALMDDEVFRWHAYTSLWLEGRWVKATPAFDNALCERHGIKPLDFNGREDSIFHPFDRQGRHHMEYLDFIGEFDDLPYETFAAEMRKAYPRMLEALDRERVLRQGRGG